MKIDIIKTHRINCGESLQIILDRYIRSLEEETILVITSKIVSLCEGQVVKKSSIDKYTLIRKEADVVLQTEDSSSEVYLTIRNGLLIPSAGIDESNADDVYILYPKDVQTTALSILQYVKEKYGLYKLGVIITDSTTRIMRKGVTGVALGWSGFSPLYSYIGSEDLYGRPFKFTQVNIVDSLAASAVFVMGEGKEQTPIAIITEAPRIHFFEEPGIQNTNDIKIPLEDDLYAPLLKHAKWR